jgi:hypothetical protein
MSEGAQLPALRVARHACIGAVLMPVAMLIGCSRVEPKVPYPHESVMTIMAELKLGLESDPYTDPPGRDLEGRNIFRVSLERLDQLGALLPQEYKDVVAFARGECLERVGDWTGAALAFEDAARTSSSLTAIAAERARNAQRMAQFTDREQFSKESLELYLNDLDALQLKLRGWSEESPPPGAPYPSHILREMERAREEYAALLFLNRMVVANAVERSLAMAKSLSDENRESARATQHDLTLGTMYETLARDWMARNRPEDAGIAEGSAWSQWVEQARAAYRRAALADGDPAKPEGQARLRALDAYALHMQGLAQ